jgi:large subunit ribosomal protein L13
MNSKTTVVKKPITTRKWHLIDLSGQNLGRVSTKIAQILIGKHHPLFSYHRDDGDYVVAINASKVVVTGNKLNDKIYYHYTGYAGNLRELSLKTLMVKDPRLVINHAVAGMLPKNRLRDKRLSRLKIFAGSEHPYTDKLNH